MLFKPRCNNPHGLRCTAIALLQAKPLSWLTLRLATHSGSFERQPIAENPRSALAGIVRGFTLASPTTASVLSLLPSMIGHYSIGKRVATALPHSVAVPSVCLSTTSFTNGGIRWIRSPGLMSLELPPEHRPDYVRLSPQPLSGFYLAPAPGHQQVVEKFARQ